MKLTYYRRLARRITFTLIMGLCYLPAAFAAAGYERVASVGVFDDLYTETFTVESASNFRLTLTDFALPDALSRSGVAITQGGDTLANLNLFSQPLRDPFYNSSSKYHAYSIFDFARTAWAGASAPANTYNSSLGADKQQTSTIVFLDEGTYFISMWGQFDQTLKFSQINPAGLYGVELAAVPVPASVLFMSSGLAMLGFISRRKRKAA